MIQSALPFCRVRRSLGAAALALALLAAPAARAVEPAAPGGAGGVTFGAGFGDASTMRRLDLSIGRSTVIELPRDAKEVFVANPAIANAIVRSARKIFLIGVANGATTVFMMDAEGRQIAGVEVNVGRDLNVLRQTLKTAVPNGRIEVKPAGDSIILIGTVSTAGEASQAADIAKAFVGQSSGGSISLGGGTGLNVAGAGQAGNVINALTIAGRDQVMLKVTVVEIARTALKQLGVNVGGNWNIVDVATNIATNPASGLSRFGSGLLASSAGGADGAASIQGQAAIGRSATIGGTLTALERSGFSRILAEPSLVAISGESASFLAGGEIPIVVNSCSGGSGTGNFCTPIVTYKQYGVQLAFTPIVQSPGRISLHVVTEVSEIDRDNQDAVTRSPGFRTRKQTTTVELPSGGTMVTAGLISSQSSQTVEGVPGLINLPVLGALFRSRNFQRRDSELMIMVTPYIAKPADAAQIARPDDGFVDANDAQTVLLGRLNKIYGGNRGPGAARASSGRFGFITD